MYVVAVQVEVSSSIPSRSSSVRVDLVAVRVEVVVASE